MCKLATIALGYVVLISGGCNSSTSNTKDTVTETHTRSGTITVPAFNAENAYAHIEAQVAFGPRVPGTIAQTQCAAWMKSKLQEYCDTVYVQQTQLTAGDKKTRLPCINLIGSFHPQAKTRILLLAHWDTRPWADRDSRDKDKPIDGADDGGSGVGVLLELARVIRENPLNNPDLGIDILLTDVEDYGKSEWGDDSYALGTQYWTRNPHVAGYKAKAGILLDMVGGKNARFPMEGNSQQYAPGVLREVWAAAGQSGYSSYFVYEQGGSITDDHVPVNEIIKIPTIDIINLPAGSSTGFVNHWHTHEDNMTNIDKGTLKAVGQTLLQYLYTQ